MIEISIDINHAIYTKKLEQILNENDFFQILSLLIFRNSIFTHL